MKKDNNAELLPIVDEKGKVVGRATRGECHSGTKLLHPVVHLHLFDTDGRLYLQHRPIWKEIQPDKWDTAVGGHIDYGEEVVEALNREIREELGVTNCEPRFLQSYIFESEREKELVYVYSAVYDGEIIPSDELDGGRFWNIAELDNAMGKGLLTPNFEQEFQKVRQWMEI
ncbi:MAG: NUDIX domain-containing protein [Alistipes sp.]|nr:NUDIX domain-containing protein [Alistipes sp.]